MFNKCVDIKLINEIIATHIYTFINIKDHNYVPPVYWDPFENLVQEPSWEEGLHSVLVEEVRLQLQVPSLSPTLHLSGK